MYTIRTDDERIVLCFVDFLFTGQVTDMNCGTVFLLFDRFEGYSKIQRVGVQIRDDSLCFVLLMCDVGRSQTHHIMPYHGFVLNE